MEDPNFWKKMLPGTHLLDVCACLWMCAQW